MDQADTSVVYAPADLRAFLRGLFGAGGLEPKKAEVVAEHLVDADLMGHTTHGLALAPRYLDDLASGSMNAAGEPEIISDRGACASWDGQRLSGVYLTAKAVDIAIERAPTYGTVSMAIRNSHHIACLSTYLPRATARGFMVIVASSDPSQASIAPFGGTRAVFSPDPIAVGIPTDKDPILIDTSASVTTNNMSARLLREGRRYPSPWLLDAAGEPTDDPDALRNKGTILPAGGLDHGQKGYSWALLIEALTQGLGGFGRAEAPKGWGASVFVQVIDPSAFAGQEGFIRQTSWLARACQTNPPRPGLASVRLPGEQGLARQRAAQSKGVTLYPGLIEGLDPWAKRLGIALPEPLASPATAG